MHQSFTYDNTDKQNRCEEEIIQQQATFELQGKSLLVSELKREVAGNLFHKYDYK